MRSVRREHRPGGRELMDQQSYTSLRRRLATVVLCLGVVGASGTTTAAAQDAAPPGRVAFAITATDTADTSGGLAAAELDGTDVRRLTAAPVDGPADGNPRWSPDGHWLAFTREGAQGTQPMAVAAGGGEPVALADEGRDPAWSRDASRIVWTTATPAPALVVAQVLDRDPHLVLGEQRRVELPAAADGPRLAPTADTVLFRMQRPDGTTGADLWTVELDGTGLRQLTYDVDVDAASADGHTWSPDGTMIAFLAADAASRGNPRAQIVAADGSGQRLLFPSSRCEHSRGVRWAPHGEFVAVLQSCQTRGFHMVTPSGEWIGSVGADARRYGGFAFSADGADLYAASRPQSTTEPISGELLRIPVDGSAPRPLATTPDVALAPIDVVTLADVSPRLVLPPPPPDDTDPDDDDGQQTRPQLRLACPVREVPYADFLDVGVDSTHRLAIDCMAWWGLVSGVAEHEYGPSGLVSRGQMASMLARVVVAGGPPLPADPPDRFDDDDGSPHEGNIDALAAAGIVNGDAQGRFRPGAPVRRDQMATFVVAAYAYASAAAPPEASRDHFFDDDHSVHHRAINMAAESGFVAGLGDGRYAPERLERRDHAAARAARLLDALVEQGQASPPREGLARVTRVIDGDTVLANDPVDGTIRVRFLGINAPESGTCGARRARLALRDLVLDKTIRVSSDDPSSIGAQQRPLRYVEVYDDARGWIDVNAEQLAQGHALWLSKAKEPRNSEAYQLAVRAAMAQRLNLWDPVACGRGPHQAAQLHLWVRPNPPGPDARDLNGEWVRIHNRGTVDVDLTGWQLRDGSVRRAYQFTGDSRLPAGATMTVHVGDGVDEPLVRYWGQTKPVFSNPRRVQGQRIGDGAYLLDYDGDIRAHTMYPCIGPCPDPLIGKVTIARVAYDPPDDDVRPNAEFVRLRNLSDQHMPLWGYLLRTGSAAYEFGPEAGIAPGGTLTVRVGRGVDTPTRLHWGQDTALLDDVTGMVTLRTFDRIRIACFAWGDVAC